MTLQECLECTPVQAKYAYTELLGQLPEKKTNTEENYSFDETMYQKDLAYNRAISDVQAVLAGFFGVEG